MNAARTSSTALTRRQQELTFLVNTASFRTAAEGGPSGGTVAEAAFPPWENDCPASSRGAGHFSDFEPRDHSGRGGAAGGLTAPI